MAARAVAPALAQPRTSAAPAVPNDWWPGLRGLGRQGELQLGRGAAVAQLDSGPDGGHSSTTARRLAKTARVAGGEGAGLQRPHAGIRRKVRKRKKENWEMVHTKK